MRNSLPRSRSRLIPRFPYTHILIPLEERGDAAAGGMVWPDCLCCGARRRIIQTFLSFSGCQWDEFFIYFLFILSLHEMNSGCPVGVNLALMEEGDGRHLEDVELAVLIHDRDVESRVKLSVLHV